MQAQLLIGALRRRPEFRILTCAMDTDAMLHAVAASPALVALLSMNHSESVAEQLDALRRFHLSQPGVAKILLVASYDRELVVSAFRAGVRGIFCISDLHFRELCKCIQRVAGGQVWANTEQMNYLMDLVAEVPWVRVISARGNAMLTAREEQVVVLVAEGLSNREIARELKLSEHTIKKYLFRMFDKLGISTRVELVLYAVSHGDPLRAKWLATLERTGSDG
jgi:DNA-binding NarL/FixJ family response regulator